MVRVLGDAGPPVLLLPGGAEAVEGFFPGLVEGLLADPGCRIVLHDRPGTEGSVVDGDLAGAADALHATITDLDLGPVVLVGQSLGGAVALLLAAAHPDDVAGLVLLDPTPVNDVRLSDRTEAGARAAARMARTPVLSLVVSGLLRLSVRGIRRRHDLTPDARAALLRMLDVDPARLGRAAQGLGAAARGFDPSRLPAVPAVVVTADRARDHAARHAHERLAEALDAPLLSPPGAEHAVHLTHPDVVLAATRRVASDAAAS